MPKDSKNSLNGLNGRKGNSFELLDEWDGNESITLQTTSAQATTSQPLPAPVGAGQWAQVEAFFTRVKTALVAAEQRVEKAEKRIESLEEFIRNELFPRISTSPSTGLPPSPPPPSSLPLSVALNHIPKIGLDLSRVAVLGIREGNAGAVHRRVNEALYERDIMCLKVNSKGNRRYRLLF
ncbi:hypothetical protein K469DRAFT_687351 [Zopfia rhizophila CBS 207.26]|uniref:Uncharacterized protein n=1 Tax=Zopfia rhizophila CBS 207.26 TaxID=1314779 RepID=A0A6A6E3B0_9PEZI|nr:hypothetical protein K469DRAFT_687351 [Zopfia rhizophila CBS 207.26]